MPYPVGTKVRIIKERCGHRLAIGCVYALGIYDPSSENYEVYGKIGVEDFPWYVMEDEFEVVTEEPTAKILNNDEKFIKNGLQAAIDSCCVTGSGTLEGQPKEDSKFNEITKSAHYNIGNYEVIDVLNDWLSKEELKGFHRGNVLKYVARYQLKGGVKDLNKAKYYLEKLIEIVGEDSES